MWLKEGENGNTSLIISDAQDFGRTYVAASIPGPVSDMKLYVIEPDMVAIALVGQASPDGSLFNPKDVQKPLSTGRIYDNLFVRHWDRYETKEKSAIFTGLLQKSAPHVTEREGRWHLSGLKNALRGTGLESSIPTFGGKEHFDIGKEGLIFVAKDPELDPATHTKCDCYYVPKEDLMSMNVSKPRKLLVPALEGWATSPVFSPDGKSIAFLKMEIDGYESGQNCIVVFLDATSRLASDQDVDGEIQFQSKEHPHPWELSPSAISWAVDSNSLYIQAEKAGRGLLYSHVLKKKPGDPNLYPSQLTTNGSIEEVLPVAANSDKLFITRSTLVDSSEYAILDPANPHHLDTILSATNQGSSLGLSPSQVSELWWKGARDHPIHAWMIKPSFYKEGKKYPLAYLVHGGPQGAWEDAWSTRWNPAVFAEQGYIVIAPNPTGSTGYGQPFTDAIRNDWGGAPYDDLAAGFEYIKKELDFVDTDRAVALGASYGGYMMNWIQGHDLGKKFKALVCHDGVWSMTAQAASDEQYFPIHDLGGPIWERQEMYDKWDPSRHTGEWETPMLVIHSERDYRLSIAEGLAAFNILQMRGIESRFLTFPDENHFVLGHENSLVWHTTVINWINKFVGLPPLGAKGEGEGEGADELYVMK